MRTKLYRSRAHKRIAGVCGGLGQYLGINSDLVRLFFLLLLLPFGVGVLIYLLLWLIVPLEGQPEEATRLEGGETMKCPKCAAPKERLVVTRFDRMMCIDCGTTYAGDDLLMLRHLEFLLAEMDGWAERLPADLMEELRQPYAERLAELRARLIAEPTPPPLPVEVAPPRPAVEAAPAPARAVPAVRPPPKAERIPFDEWLLSERNIKIALYSGALLLAGIIFIGSKWGEFGGPQKFAVMLLATGLLYLGGYLFYQRRGLRLGGVAVLGVASGFLPLNFALLQIYVLGPGGLRDDLMWLIASPMCLLLYALTAYWTRADLFTYISIGALVSTLTAGLTVAGVPVLAYPLAHLLLALTLLLLARRLSSRPLGEQPTRL